MFAHERQATIIEMLRKRRRFDVRELASTLGISSATLRRDLSLLDRNNLVRRVHGGVLLPGDGAEEASLRQKSVTAMQAKRRIAARVAGTIPRGATVFIDGGTTCLEAGLLLRRRADLTLVTNSLPLLAGYERFAARLIVPGGELRAVSGALVGSIALDALARLRADVALIGASGLHPADGASTTELLEASIKQQWIQKSGRVCLLADASKWRQPAAIRFADWGEFQEFFTDTRPPPAFHRKTLGIILP